ncbi:MAG: hypothetical protein R3E32_09515 [Chitinophagales bacterium]
MKKINLFAFVIATMSILSAGCSTTKNVLPEDYSVNAVSLPFDVLKIEIVDKREMPLLLMDWGLLNNSNKSVWKGNPELSQTNKSDIENIIRQSSKSDEGIAANFRLSVVEGRCEFYGAAIEDVVFKATLFIQVPNDNVSFDANIEIRYENPAKKATKEYTIELYNLAVRNAINALLKEVKKGLPH